MLNNINNVKTVQTTWLKLEYRCNCGTTQFLLQLGIVYLFVVVIGLQKSSWSACRPHPDHIPRLPVYCLSIRSLPHLPSASACLPACRPVYMRAYRV